MSIKSILQNFLKKYSCRLLGHKPGCVKPLQFADGSFGQIPVFCKVCGEGELQMVVDGVDANEINIMKLEYNKYLLNYDNMR